MFRGQFQEDCASLHSFLCPVYINGCHQAHFVKVEDINPLCGVSETEPVSLYLFAWIKNVYTDKYCCARETEETYIS